MSSLYRRRQVGKMIIALLSGQVILIAGLLVAIARTPLVIGVLVGTLLLMLGVGFAFCTLTIDVNERRVRAWFGPGWIWREIPIEQITAVRVVENRWYWGWGIRRTPHGWMFNIGGLEAVEVEMNSGKKFRFGSEEPQQLAQAIKRAIG